MSISTDREFAVSIVRQLRAAGFEGLWAGGCVRDQLLGKQPKDYDVATDARPDQIRDLFGRRRTLAIGAAFGVITVLGPRKSQVEVATFREDAEYSDGRRPDAVVYSTAEHDAQRRDFTINGLFYDPLEERVIDYVGGQRDLQRRLVRAIGSADERIREDKLRMLRAVRFTATLNFEIDPETLSAVRDHAATITVVSGERIAAELRRSFAGDAAVRSLQLLAEAKLIEPVFPEAVALWNDAPTRQSILKTLAALQSYPTMAAAGEHHFSARLAAILTGHPQPLDAVSAAGKRWRLANHEINEAARLLTHQALILEAERIPWPQVQRVLAEDGADRLLDWVAAGNGGDSNSGVAHCRSRIAVPREQWDPPLLIRGDDLKKLGIPAGRQYRILLSAVRDEQLDGRITSAEEALQWIATRWKADN